MLSANFSAIIYEINGARKAKQLLTYGHFDRWAVLFVYARYKDKR